MITGERETPDRPYRREVHESETGLVWIHEVTRPRIRRKKDSGGGTTREKKTRKVNVEMDGLCQPRHESYQDNKRRSP